MLNFDYLYNSSTRENAHKKFLSQNHFTDEKLGFQVIEQGTVLPYEKEFDGKLPKYGWGFGGIVDSNGKFVEGSHVCHGVGAAYTPPPRINSI